jgi:transcriptional regulator with XRE-family HTH domain
MIDVSKEEKYMTLGEKLKELRKETNISQEELAEKVGVSRQAVAKWERDNGLPDTENLKSIATLFNISIDELLDYKKELLDSVVLEEEYSLEGIKKEGKARTKEEALMIKKFNKALSIYALQQKKKWNWKKNLFWFIVEPLYSPELEDIVDNGIYYLFLVEEKDKQYLVTMKKGKMKVIQLKTLFKSNKLVINDYIYKKMYQVK